MTDFTARVSRYDRAKAERRTSAPQWLRASSFDDAYDKARLLVAGMRAIDPDRDYQITELTQRGVSGAICLEGSRAFETEDEYEARIAAEIEQESQRA